MKSTALAILATLLILPNLSFGFGGIGDVVTDPGSYTHYIKQLKATAENVEANVKQVRTLGDLRKEVGRYQRLMEGRYSHMELMQRDFKRMGRVMDDIDPTSLFGDGIIFNFDDPATWGEQIDVNIDKIFVDPATAELDWAAGERSATEMQRIYKTAMKEAQLQIVRTSEGIKRQQDIVKKIGKTENVKDAVALTNTLLTMIIENTERMIRLMARSQEMEAATQYVGSRERFSALFADEKKFKEMYGKEAEKESYFEKLIHDRGMPTWEEMTDRQRRCFGPMSGGWLDIPRCEGIGTTTEYQRNVDIMWGSR